MSTRHAACSCEQLMLTVEGEPLRVSICHCLSCQRRSGSVFAAQAFFDAEQVTIEGVSRRYARVSDSGEGVFHFCPDCGATVFYIKEEAFPGLVASQWARSPIRPSRRRRSRSGRSDDIRGWGFQTRSTTWSSRTRGAAPWASVLTPERLRLDHVNHLGNAWLDLVCHQAHNARRGESRPLKK